MKSIESYQVVNLLLSESEYVPNYSVWDSLEAFTLTQDQCEEIEMIPFNKFFEIPASGPCFGTMNMLLDELRPDGDKKTCLKKVAFKYTKNKTNGKVYLFVMCMTNKSARRSKDTPFIFEHIIDNIS